MDVEEGGGREGGGSGGIGVYPYSKLIIVVVFNK